MIADASSVGLGATTERTRYYLLCKQQFATFVALQTVTRTLTIQEVEKESAVDLKRERRLTNRKLERLWRKLHNRQNELCCILEVIFRGKRLRIVILTSWRERESFWRCSWGTPMNQLNKTTTERESMVTKEWQWCWTCLQKIIRMSSIRRSIVTWTFTP